MSSYDGWTKQALIHRIHQLESLAVPSISTSTLQSSQNETDSENNPVTPSTTPSATSRRRQTHVIKFEKYTKRPIALKVAYLGWEYYGFASQESHKLPSIESHLFDALARARLIDPTQERRTFNYARCGRTDRGVSSFGQVVNLYVRSNLKVGGSVVPWDTPVHTFPTSPEPEDSETTEIAYVSTLNRMLPPDIRVLAWSPCRPNFSARFDCLFRRYRYYFHLTPSLNLEKMARAASYLEGQHDYRNFAKVDMNKVEQSYTRSIYTAHFIPLTDSHPNSQSLCSEFRAMAFEVKGSSFLWHQVRNLMSVLLLIGQGHEEPEVILDLMDMTKQPLDKNGQPTGRPIYTMADDKPLVLVECGFADGELNWKDEDAKQHVLILHSLWDMYNQHHIKAVSVSDLLSIFQHSKSPSLLAELEKPRHDKLSLAGGHYVPLMHRPRADSALDRWDRKNARSTLQN